ncbi:MAG TPA: hypothetical protein VHZ51_16105, partial [Ktedonobacteraceae bacterium]|nr:hypothetical protein [Ktedonobacteraceae bacterium]
YPACIEALIDARTGSDEWSFAAAGNGETTSSIIISIVCRAGGNEQDNCSQQAKKNELSDESIESIESIRTESAHVLQLQTYSARNLFFLLYGCGEKTTRSFASWMNAAHSP